MSEQDAEARLQTLIDDCNFVIVGIELALAIRPEKPHEWKVSVIMHQLRAAVGRAQNE